MKKFFTIIALLGIIMSSIFADTIRVFRPTSSGSFEVFEYKNMKFNFNARGRANLKDNEYFFEYDSLIYKVNGKCYGTLMYEIEYDD